MGRHAEPGGDFFRAEPAFFGQLLERLELVGGMHVLARDVFVEADFVGIVRGVDDATDRFGLLDLLALDAQKLRQPPAFADGENPVAAPSASNSGSTTMIFPRKNGQG